MADKKPASNFDLSAAYAQAQPAGGGMEEAVAIDEAAGQPPAEEVTMVSLEIPSDQLNNMKSWAGEGKFEEIGKLVASLISG